MAEVSLVTCYNGKGELLLGRRRDSGKWTLPGGHLNEGESPEDGAKRELHEETGLVPESLSSLLIYPLADGTKLNCFSAFVTGEPHGKLDPDQEVEEWKFFETNDLPKNLHGPQDFDQNLVLKLFGLANAKKFGLKKAEDEVFRMLEHPDQNERLMALRLRSAGQIHAQHAALDPDPVVHQAAIAHSQFDTHAALRVLEADAAHDGTYPLAQKLAVLAKPDVDEFHVGAAIRSAQKAPSDVSERLHEAIVSHPRLSTGYARELYHDPAVSFPNRVKLMSHEAVPDDVLNHAIQSGLLVPSHETQEVAKAAAQHPKLPDSVKDYLVRTALDTIHPHIQAIAQHCLANNIIPGTTIDYVLRRAHLNSSVPTHVGLVGAALRGPASTTEHIERALALPDPRAMEAILGARGLKIEHINKINERLNYSPLEKAIDPEHFVAVVKALHNDGSKVVDHEPHLKAHPQSIGPEVEAYRSQILNSPAKVRKLGRGAGPGITRKVVYRAHVSGQDASTKFMVKPYHERPVQRLRNWCQHPIQGWAEMTNQALYHAAGIGHLHQKVHVSEHDMGPGHEHEPSLVVHMENGLDPQYAYGPLAGNGHLIPGLGVHADVRKIAMMDFLTNNLDRHGGNLMHTKDGEEEVRAIDHSRSFQYMSPRDDEIKWKAPTKRPREVSDSFGDYHTDSALQQASRFMPTHDQLPDADWQERKMQALQAYMPIFDWWGENSAKVRDEFGRHLEYIKDPEIRAHVKRNFEARADWLDERAHLGLENYGTDWYKDPVSMYKPGQLTDHEIDALETKRARELYEKEEAERKAGLKKAVAKLVDYVKLNG